MKKLLILLVVFLLTGCSKMTPDNFLSAYNKKCEEISAIEADTFYEEDGELYATITGTSGFTCTVDKSGNINNLVYTADLINGDFFDAMKNWNALLLTFESVENAKIIMGKFTPLFEDGQPMNRDVSFTLNGVEYMTIPVDDDYLTFGIKGAN